MADMTGAAGTKTINQSRRVRSLGKGKPKLKMPRMSNIKKKTKRNPKVKSRSYRKRS